MANQITVMEHGLNKTTMDIYRVAMELQILKMRLQGVHIPASCREKIRGLNDNFALCTRRLGDCEERFLNLKTALGKTEDLWKTTERVLCNNQMDVPEMTAVNGTEAAFADETDWAAKRGRFNFDIDELKRTASGEIKVDPEIFDSSKIQSVYYLYMADPAQKLLPHIGHTAIMLVDENGNGYYYTVMGVGESTENVYLGMRYL